MKHNRSSLMSLLQRTDVLLLFLALLVSFLLVQRYGQRPPVAVYEAPPSTTLEQPQLFSANAAEDAATTPQKTPARQGSAVRFLMYNAQNYFVDADVKRSPHPRRAKSVREREIVADVIASVKPEVVGLIEIGGPAALSDLQERLAARGLHYTAAKVLTRWGEDRALAVLSRHPIVEDHSVAECALLGQTNRRMLRGILDVTVSVQQKGKAERRFRIVGAHLKSRVGDNPGAAQSLRAREARTLADHVQRAIAANPNEPLLVYGDWNDGPAEPTLAVLTHAPKRELSLSRLAPKDSRGESWTIFYKQGNEYSTFDQIYVNSALNRRMGRKAQMGIVDYEVGRGASDHRAVWCDMH